MGPLSVGIGGLVMGIAIAAMHYVGMDAMRLSIRPCCGFCSGCMAQASNTSSKPTAGAFILIWRSFSIESITTN